MGKRFLFRQNIIFILIIFLILNQAPAWSRENTINLKSTNINEIYTIEKNTFQEKALPFQLVEHLENSNKNSMLWMASILIPGLGQILTGDLMRGLTFTAMIAVLICAWGISRAVNLTFFLATLFTGKPSAHLFDFVEIFIIFMIGIVHIWNIFDAWYFSKEVSEFDDNSEAELAYFPDSGNISLSFQQSYLTIEF